MPKHRPDPISRIGYRAFVTALLILAAAAGAVWWGWSGPRDVRRAPAPPRRVLLITIDTLRADALGSYGSVRARTPWMDRLAAEGIRFDNAHAHNVVTLPSHANILSGRYPFDHGVRDNAGFRFPASQETLATLLEARGYHTAAFVSAFPLDSRFGLDRGFDVYDDSFVDASTQHAFLVQERPATETVAHAQAWLDAQGDAPVFCWIHVFEPHFPYPDGYDADVAAADAALGPLLEPILAEGRAGRTLVILTSDHGESLGEHGEATHGVFAYESTLKVPLMLYQPRLWEPAVISDPVRHVDLLPTVFDALGLPVPGGLPGRSLLTLIAGASPGETVTYFEALSGPLNRGWAPLYGVLRGHSKYIDLPIPELYDLDSDAREERNLAIHQSSRAGEMRLLLDSFSAHERGVERRPERAETLEQLRSLGYVGSRAPAAARSYGEGDDPKRLIELDRILQDVVGLYLDGHVSEALARCRDLVARRPTMVVSLLHLAHLEREAGNLTGGIDALRKAVASSPDDVEALSLLGAYLTEAGGGAEAIRILDRHARTSEADVQVLVSYGLALAKLGRFAEARSTFDRARERDGSNAMLLVERGTVHMMAGDPARAREDFEAALTLNPRVARAHSSIGVLDAESGRADEAIAHWREAVAIDPTEHQKLFALGAFHWRAGRTTIARPYLEFFVSNAPERYVREIVVARRWLEQSR